MFGRLAVIGAIAFSIFVVGKAVNFVTGVGGKAPVVTVGSEDAEVNAAHAKAKRTIGEFWAALERKRANEKNFAMKVRFPIKGYKDSAEHMWITDIRREGPGAYSGRLDNEPDYITDFKIGQRVTFTDAMISDWMFTRNGKIVGNESMRPLLAHLPKEKADKLRMMLENP